MYKTNIWSQHTLKNGIERISVKSENMAPEIVVKKWGQEIIIANNDSYCGKILKFKRGAKFSMHYHMIKSESWYIVKGALNLYYYDLETAQMKFQSLCEGNVIHIPAGNPHQLEALEDSDVFEVSTTHYDSDSYRVLPSKEPLKAVPIESNLIFNENDEVISTSVFYQVTQEMLQKYPKRARYWKPGPPII